MWLIEIIYSRFLEDTIMCILLEKQCEELSVMFFSFPMQVSVKELSVEDHDHLSASITCHMCYSVEVGKSERAKMLSCKCCGKKYHRNCVKPWAQHRGIVPYFHRNILLMSRAA